jgi:hypothetical protein
LIRYPDDKAGLGKAFLTALNAARTNRPTGRDPMVVVAASRHTDPVLPLLTAAGIPPTPLSGWLRPDTAASHTDWTQHCQQDGHWLYPIRLTDLNQDAVAKAAQKRVPGAELWAGFIHSLTNGHPWGVRKVVDTLNNQTPGNLPHRQRLAESALSGVLEAQVPGHDGQLGDVALAELLLDDLPNRAADRLPACAAAMEVMGAQEAGLAGRFSLATELTHRFWLEPGPTAESWALHPWLRRLLIRRLATQPTWQAVHRALRGKCEPDTVAAAYYDLAMENFTETATWLAKRFDRVRQGDGLTAEGWIAEFNTITSAPNRLDRTVTAEKRQEKLLSEHLTGDPESLFATIFTLVITRWVWSDPLGDPLLTLNPILKHGFGELAVRCPRGQLRLADEATFYELGGRPSGGGIDAT